MDAQVRLLRVLQEKEFETVGGTRPVKVDIRIIAATHRNLESMITEGQFRQDLFFRLKVFPINIPPLKERKEDITALVHHFIRKKFREMGLGECPVLAGKAMKRLNNYDWPGNVRELENAVERAIILNHSEPLEFDDISKSEMQSDQNVNTFDDQIFLLDEVISQHIRQILKKTGGKVGGIGGAAELMGINPATLRHKMRKLGVPFGRNAKYYE